MLNCWTAAIEHKLDDAGGEQDCDNKPADTNLQMENIDRLLECCRKYLQ